MNILVTPAHWHAVAGAVRSFSRAGHRVFVLSSQEHWPLHHSRHTAGFYIIDESDEKEWLNGLLKILKRETPTHNKQETVSSFDCFIPFSDRSLERTLRYKTQIEPFTRLFLPDQDKARICLDKELFYDFCLRHDLPIVPTERVSLPDAFTDKVRRYPLPFIIKERTGQAGSGVTFIMDEHGRGLVLASAAARSYPVLIQPYAGETQAGSFAIARRGELLGYFAFLTKEKWARWGSPPAVWSCDDPRLLSLTKRTKRIVAALEWTGVIDLDFILSAKDEIFILEANPRFSGTSLFAYVMGWDLFKDWLSLQQGGAMDGRHNGIWFPGGRCFTHILPEWLRFHRKGLFSWRDMWSCFLQSRGMSNLFWDDPMMIWWHIKNTVWESRFMKGEVDDQGSG